MEKKRIIVNLEYKDVEEVKIAKFVDMIKGDFTTIEEKFGSYNLRLEKKDIELNVLSNYLAFKINNENEFPLLTRILNQTNFLKLTKNKEMKILTRYVLPSVNNFNNIVNLANPNVEHELIGFKYNDGQYNYFVTLMSRESFVEFNVLCKKKLNTLEEMEAFINNYQKTVIAQIFPIVKDKLGD